MGADYTLDVGEVSHQHQQSLDGLAVSKELSINRREIEDLFLEAGSNNRTSQPQPDSHSHSKFDCYIIYDGTHMLKSCALSLYQKCLGKGGPSSMDQLKHVQEIERYLSTTLATLMRGDTLNEAQPLLVIQDLVTIIVHCEGHLFLCLGEVNAIKINSDSSMTAIPQAELYELNKITINIQVLGLRPSNSDNDATLQNDWCLYQVKKLTIHVPGRFIQPINPELVSRGVGDMFYLLEGAFLVGLATSILGSLTRKNVKELPQISVSNSFPYREHTGMCSIISYMSF